MSDNNMHDVTVDMYCELREGCEKLLSENDRLLAANKMLKREVDWLQGRADAAEATLERTMDVSNAMRRHLESDIKQKEATIYSLRHAFVGNLKP